MLSRENRARLKKGIISTSSDGRTHGRLLKIRTIDAEAMPERKGSVVELHKRFRLRPISSNSCPLPEILHASSNPSMPIVEKITNITQKSEEREDCDGAYNDTCITPTFLDLDTVSVVTPTLLDLDTVSIAEAVQRDVDNCEEFEEQANRESPYYATPMSNDSTHMPKLLVDSYNAYLSDEINLMEITEEILFECSDLFCGKQYQDDAKIQKDIPLRKKKWAAFVKVAKALRIRK